MSFEESFLNWIATAFGLATGLGVLFFLVSSLRGRKGKSAEALASFFKRDNDIRLRDLIHFFKFLSDERAIMVSGNQLVAVVQVQGVDLSSKLEREVRSIFLGRQRMLKDQAKKGLQVRQISPRLKVDFTGHIQGDDAEAAFTSRYAYLVFRKWMGKFRRSYRNSHYFVLSLPSTTKDARRELMTAVKNVMDGMEEYKPKLLNPKMDLSGEGGPAMFWSSMLNPCMDVSPGLDQGPEVDFHGARSDLTTRLADQWIHSRVHVEGDVYEKDTEKWFRFRQKDGYLVFTRGDKTVWMSAISLSKWSGSVSASLWSELLTLQESMQLVQWWTVHDQETSLQIVNQKRREEVRAITESTVVSSDDAQEYNRLQDQLAKKGAEAERLVSYQATVFVMGETRRDLMQALDDVEAIARSMRSGSFKREDRALRALWLSIFPPNMEWVRKTDIKTANVASLTSLNDTPTGMMKNDWGPRPLVVFPTSMGSPYALNMHISERDRAVGHIMTIIPSDGGKTTLLTFFAAMASGYKDHHTVLMDREDGAYVATKALGGAYNHLFTDIDVGAEKVDLAPLHMPGATKVEANHPDARFIINWILGPLCNMDAGGDDESRQLLERALQALDSLPLQDRSLIELAKMIDGQTRLGKALSRWADPDRPDSGFFNGRRDTLSFDQSRLTAFDMTLVDERLMSAFFPYLMHRLLTTMKAKKAPFLMIADEIAANLRYPVFAQYIARALEEWRKNRGVLAMSFQHPQQIFDIGDLKAREAILTQTKTKIVAPDSSWNKNQFVDGLGFTESEFEHISGQSETAKRLAGTRWVMVKREGQGSVIVNVDLSGLGELFKPFRASGSGPAIEYRALEQAFGDDALRHFMAS